MYDDAVFIKTIDANFEGRDFVVGDIHGCYYQLMELLSHVGFNPAYDRLFSVGDLIDRGPNSLECLSLTGEDWFYAVLGNHEDMLIEKMREYKNGQKDRLTIDDVKDVETFLPFYENLIKMPLILEINHLLFKDNIYVVHSEFLPEHFQDNTDKDESERIISGMKKFDFSDKIKNYIESNRDKSIPLDQKQRLIWSRKIISSFMADIKKLDDDQVSDFIKDAKFEQNIKIFSGHNVVPFPLKVGQQFYIDTGAAIGLREGAYGTSLFQKMGHVFFGLTMVDITTGECYCNITSEKNRGKIVKLSRSLYQSAI